MAPEDSLELAELRRLRERLHELAGFVQTEVVGPLQRLTWRVDELERQATKYVPIVEAMMEADTLSKQLAARLGERSGARWGRLSGTIAALAAVGVFGGFVLELLHTFGVIA